MTQLAWDETGDRTYETGVDHGVLYIPDDSGNYTEGYAWNGLTTVTESPTGAEATPQYADNIKYLNLISTEEFGATIEAFTYPDEFAQCDGTAEPQPGVAIGQQSRKTFGLVYRTLYGNDIDGTDYGYKLHLVYGATAAPSEKAYATVNDTPEAIAFSWAVTTTPVSVSGLKPTALVTIDSSKVDSGDLATLEAQLFGAEGIDPNLPLPDAVIAFFTGEVTAVRLTGANAPAYVSGTHILTLPTVTGITWYINGVETDPGAQPALTSGESSYVTAVALPGYYITGDSDWAFDY